MERSEIVSQILAILEDVAEISPEDVTEDSVLMDDLDLSSAGPVGFLFGKKRSQGISDDRGVAARRLAAS